MNLYKKDTKIDKQKKEKSDKKIYKEKSDKKIDKEKSDKKIDKEKNDKKIDKEKSDKKIDKEKSDKKIDKEKKDKIKIKSKPKSKKGGDPGNQSTRTNVILLDNEKPQIPLTQFPQFEFEGGEGFTCVKFTLQPQQSIRADGGTMNYLTNQIELETKTGNFWGALGRTLSGSSFFYNIFTNNGNSPGIINFSGINPGNIGCFYIPKGESFNFVSNSYICSTPDLVIETSIKFGGLITGYGISYVRAYAPERDGLIWISSFGDVLPITLSKRGDRIRVDNGVLLAFHGNVDIKTKTAGGVVITIFSKEGLVSEIINQDDNECIIYLKSRSKEKYNQYIAKIAHESN